LSATTDDDEEDDDPFACVGTDTGADVCWVRECDPDDEEEECSSEGRP
jgi:hypothetical protein